MVEHAILGFLGVNIVYFIVSFIWQMPESTNFGNVLCSTLPMFLFYYLSARGTITDKSLQVFLSIAAIAAVLYFFHAEKVSLIERIYREAGGITVNASTIFLVLIPFLFFVKNKPMLFILMAEICFFIIYAAKRGNIVAAIIPLELLSIKQFRYNSNQFGKIVMIIGLLVLANFAYNHFVNNAYLMRRMEKTMEGNSSGRDVIYAKAWEEWSQSNSMKNLIFGYGTDGTLRKIGIRAHNDWLEILVDFGILGISFYFLFFASLFRAALRLWKNDRDRAYLLLSVLSIWFLKSLYSMGFTENLFSYLSMVIGIVLGRSVQINDSSSPGISKLPNKNKHR